MIRKFIYVACCFWVTSGGSVLHASSADEIAWEKLQGLGHVESFAVDQPQGLNPAKKLSVFVRLPDGYLDRGAKTYPAVYLLDGGINFPLLAAYYTYLRLMDEVPDLILIGISYGANSFAEGNTRGHDFTAPSSERAHYGGAEKFEQFLSTVIMSEVGKRYSINKSRQILFGQSLGGQFALYSAMYGEAPFYAVIVSNPALHRNLEFFKQPLRKRESRPKAFIASAEFDDEQFRIPARHWLQHWLERAPDWEREFQVLFDHNHLSATPETFRRGLKWVFGKK